MSLWDILGSLGAAGVSYAGMENMQEDLINAGQAAQTGAQQIGQTAFTSSQFQPFAVTSGTGGVQTTGTGGSTITLSPQQQALQQSLFGTQQGMANQLAGFDPSQFNQLMSQGLTGAGSFMGQVGQLDPTLQAQRGLMGGLFGQQYSQYGQPTGLEGLIQQSLGLGQQQIGMAGQAPADIEALRSQYMGLSGQAANQLSQFDRAGREQDIYSRMRAMQSPEEERQRLALEQRLQAQGRGGVQTAQFGGTPEQLAMAKAQAEAQNQAGLMAMQQAGSEEQQALQKALGLSGQVGQMAGLSSQLQGQALQRGMGLSQLGMQGTAQQQQQRAQQLQQLLGLQQADIGAAGAQQALQQGTMGLASGMFGLGQQAGMSPYQMQGAGLQNMLAGLQAGYAPENQLLNQLQASTNIASIADLGRRFGAGERAETQMSGLEAMLTGQQSAAQLQGQYYSDLAGMLGQQAGGQAGLLGSLAGELGLGDYSLTDAWEDLKGLFD